MFHSPSSSSAQTFFDSPETMASPAGFVVMASFATKDKQNTAKIISLATKVLHDPLLQRDLCDRVYEIWLNDLRLQRERFREYGGIL